MSYAGGRLGELGGACVVKVSGPVAPPRLGALEVTVFASARPATVVVTTPNAEHNVRFADLPAGSMRHRDHRFEWTRAEFRGWADAVAARHGYGVRYLPVGTDDPDVCPPTQMPAVSRHG